MQFVRRPALLAAAVVTALALPLGGTPVVAEAPFAIFGEIGAPCVRVFTPPAGGNLTFVQKRGSTTIATDTTPALDSEEACLKPLRAGDRIVIKQGGATLRTVTVPNLTLSLDAITDTVVIGAPTGGTFGSALSVIDVIASVTVTARKFSVTGTEDPTDATRIIATQAVGGVVDLKGGDHALITWVNPDQDGFRITAALPSVVMGDQIWKVNGRGSSGTKVTITAKSGTTVTGTLVAKASLVDGRWNGTIRKNGTPVPLEPGWKLFHSQIAGTAMTVLDNDFLIDWTGEGTLSQPCYPGGRWVVLWKGVPTSFGTTPADGLVEVPSITNGLGSLGPDERVEIRCENRKGDGQVFWATSSE